MIDYIKIARPDHWFKNVFMFPGAFLAWLACRPVDTWSALAWLSLGLLSTSLVCSSNYTINEWLDASEDRCHPVKSNRPAAKGRITALGAYSQWLLLALTGLSMAWFIGPEFLAAQIGLVLMGVVYNVKPCRTKELPVFDILTESINNPLRLLLGWYAIKCHLIPPVSVVLAYWMLGAFFMTVKRFAEFRRIGDPARAAQYRKSFAFYSEDLLHILIVFFTTAFAFFGGLFLMRYRIELILVVPFFAGFLGYYMYLGLLPDSPTQYPEKLYKIPGFTAFGAFLVVVTLLFLVIEVPLIHQIFESTVPRGF